MRKTYYNPMLDPHCLAKMTTEMRQATIDQTYDDGGPMHEPDESHPANLVSSLCDDGWHRPALDIDIPCRVVPSSTPGHCHIYFDDLALPWDQYVILLKALAVAGVLERRWVDASIREGMTVLRPEGVRKSG